MVHALNLVVAALHRATTAVVVVVIVVVAVVVLVFAHAELVHAHHAQFLAGVVF